MVSINCEKEEREREEEKKDVEEEEEKEAFSRHPGGGRERKHFPGSQNMLLKIMEEIVNGHVCEREKCLIRALSCMRLQNAFIRMPNPLDQESW